MKIFFDAVEELLARGLPRFSLMVMAASRASGRLRRLLSGRWPSVGEVRTVFPRLSPFACRRVAATVAANESSVRVVVRGLMRCGIESLDAMPTGPITWPDRPSILLTFHVGVYQALAVGARVSPRRWMVFRYSHLYPATSHEVVATAGDASARAAAFLSAVRHLRNGGHVVIAPDMELSNAIPVTCLGREISFGRGAFALARMSGAPVVPFVARWTGRRLDVALEAALPITSEMNERQSAQVAADWLERYLQAHPEEIGLGLLRRLLGVGAESVTHAVVDD